jgi:hypothetical protein
MHVLSHAWLTVFSFENLMISKICERPKVPPDNKNYISPSSSITACRTAKGDEPFSPKCNATIAPLTACDAYYRFISEFDHKNTPITHKHNKKPLSVLQERLELCSGFFAHA